MKNNTEEYELTMDLYKSVAKKIGKKGKRMFNLFNKAGKQYKKCIILVNEENLQSGGDPTMPSE